MKEYTIDTKPLHAISIEGYEIHPNIISPLIPVASECFTDMTGNIKQCKVYEHFIADANIMDVKDKSLYFVTQMLTFVYTLNKELTYIYKIKFEETVNGGIKGSFIGI